jgi:Anti-anti-sigma regulatory factor (antagonist of anti-sigma factor)
MLKVHTHPLDNGSALCVQGQVVKGEGISTLKGAVLSQRDISVIILDLTMVDMIDAAGLGALLDLREWAQENGVEFRLENPNSRVSNLFRIARLDSVFGISSIHEVCSEAAVFDAEPRFDSAAL